jgi:hypothetical protein
VLDRTIVVAFHTVREEVELEMVFLECLRNYHRFPRNVQ